MNICNHIWKDKQTRNRFVKPLRVENGIVTYKQTFPYVDEDLEDTISEKEFFERFKKVENW